MPLSDQGVSAHRYKLIPRTLIFLKRGDRVLLLKGAPHKHIWANLYNGVGGHIERGEDVLNSARRELNEETGLDVESLRLCGTITVDTGDDTGIGIFVLTGEYRTGELIFTKEGIPEWVPITEIDRLPLVEDLTILLPHVLKMHSDDPPFAAHYTYDSHDKLLINFAE
jgi:8-oxo-dGTP diphosphatase